MHLFDTYSAHEIIAEANLPTGAVVMEAFNSIRPNSPVRLIRARQSKRVRAEPVALLAEQGRISHIGHFEQLESQLLEWDAATSNQSPDRLDAYCYAMHALAIQVEIEQPGMVPLTKEVMESAIGPPSPGKRPPEEEKPDDSRNWWPSQGGWINV